MRVVESRERDGLTRLQPEWCALQERCSEISPYQTWEWTEAWWRHFGSRKRPCILLFYADSTELVGIAPLYISRHLGMPVRRLAWMGTGPSDYLGPLTLPEHTEEVVEALLSYLERRLRGWDIADLQQMRPSAPLLRHAPRPWPHQPHSSQSVLQMEPCPYLSLPCTWEGVTQGLGKKMRSNLGYYERLLVKTFSDTRFFLADADSLEDGMTALFDLHQSRWNARWLPGVLGNKRIQAFHRLVAQRFLERGWLRLHLLSVDGTIRSALYCFAFGGRTFYYLGGFAPDLGKFSLGTLLTAHAIKQAIAEGSAEFDFLRGSEPYKYRWLPLERHNSRMLLIRPRRGVAELPGRAGFALNRMERYIEHRAKLFAEEHGRKESAPKTASGEHLPRGAVRLARALGRLKKPGSRSSE